MFGIGADKAKSKEESQANSYGYQGSVQQSGSISTDRSTASSLTGSQATSGQGLAFQDIFANLYGGAATAAGKISGGKVKNAANMLFSGGTDFLGDLQGGPAQKYLAQRISGESPVLGEQIKALGADLGKFFRNELNPAIASQAAGGGQLGGGRQGVAQGIAAGEVGEQFRRGATDLRAADIQARDAAARDFQTNRINAAGVGLGALPSLLDIQQKGSMAGLAPYQALAGILGGPTVLSESQSTSFGTSASASSGDTIASSIAKSFGEDTSSSSSKAKSKKGGFSLGF